MDKELKNRLQTKLFVGCLITPDLYRNLSTNSEYQSAKIYAAPESLIEVDYRGKHYIGRYSKASPCSSAELKLLEEDVAQKIGSIAPSFIKNHHHLFIFSQIFIT